MAYTQTYQCFEPQIWSKRINEFFKMKMQAKYCAEDYSDEIGDGASGISVPKMAAGFTATNIVTTTGAVTPTNLGDTKSTITLTRWLAASFIMTKYQAERVSKSYRLQERYAQNAAYACAKVFDKNVLGNISSANFSVGNSGTNIPSTTLEHAMAIAESQSMPLDELVWVFHPAAYWREIAAVQKYYDASMVGEKTSTTGYNFPLYGIRVLISNSVPPCAGSGHYNGLVHPQAIGFAIAGGGVQIQEIQAEALRKHYVADVLYGHALIDSTKVISVLSNA